MSYHIMVWKQCKKRPKKTDSDVWMEVLICQIVLLFVLLCCIFARCFKMITWQTFCRSILWFLFDEEEWEFLSGLSKDKSFSLQPSLKSSGWSGLVPTEVYYTNDEVFFASPASPGPQRNFEDLWGATDPSLPLPVFHYLSWILHTA